MRYAQKKRPITAADHRVRSSAVAVSGGGALSGRGVRRLGRVLATGTAGYPGLQQAGGDG